MSAQQIPDADALLQRITIDPNICHGKPCIRGLRYPVETFLELLRGYPIRLLSGILWGTRLPMRSRTEAG